MLWWVKALPLIIIVGGRRSLLLIFDFVQTLRTGNNDGAKS